MGLINPISSNLGYASSCLGQQGLLDSSSWPISLARRMVKTAANPVSIPNLPYRCGAAEPRRLPCSQVQSNSRGCSSPWGNGVDGLGESILHFNIRLLAQGGNSVSLMLMEANWQDPKCAQQVTFTMAQTQVAEICYAACVEINMLLNRLCNTFASWRRLKQGLVQTCELFNSSMIVVDMSLVLSAMRNSFLCWLRGRRGHTAIKSTSILTKYDIIPPGCMYHGTQEWRSPCQPVCSLT